MAELGTTNVHGDIRVTGEQTVGENITGDANINAKGELQEKGQRVFSPNNRNISDSVSGTSSSVYASQKAVKTAHDKANTALSTANSKLAADATAVNADKLDGFHEGAFGRLSVARDWWGKQSFRVGVELGNGVTGLTFGSGVSGHDGTADSRCYFAPRLRDNSGWKFTHEFGFDHSRNSWYFDQTPYVAGEEMWHKGNDDDLVKKGKARWAGIVSAEGYDDCYIQQSDENPTFLGGNYGATFSFYGDSQLPSSLLVAGGADFKRKVNAVQGLYDAGVRVYSAVNKPSISNLADGANVVQHLTSLPYIELASGQWGKNLHESTMVRPESVGTPAGAGGFWTIHGKRDIEGGYVGLFIGGHNSSGDGLHVGRAGSKAENPVWERVWTDKTDGAGSGLDADLLDGRQGSEYPRLAVGNTFTSNNSFTSKDTPIKTNALVFNNTEATGYYTEQTGLVAFDENFYDDVEYGTDAYAPSTVFGGNGGGLVIRNEDGWGAVLTSQNSRFADSEFRGLKVGVHRVWHKGNQGAGSGLDADKVDGIHGFQILRKDQDGQFNGKLKITAPNTTIGANYENVENGFLQVTDGNATLAFDPNEIACNTDLIISAPSVKINDGVVWTSKNHGAGSGLNADMIDGYHLDALARTNANYITAGSKVASGSGKVALTANDGKGNANVTFNHADGRPTQSGNAARIEVNTDDSTNPFFNFELGENVTQGELINLTTALTVSLSEITYKGNKVFHAGNHGAGSGLNADMVDGKHADYFARADQVKTNVPANAVFTDTQRPLTSSVTSTSSTHAATAGAVKTAYDKGVQALNVANTKVTDNGTLANDAYHYWSKEYTVSNTKIASIVNRAGAELNKNRIYRVYGHIGVTATAQGAVAVFWFQGGNWQVHRTSMSGTASNNILFSIENGVPSVSTYHSSDYPVHVYHEAYHHAAGTEGNSSRAMLGADGFMSDIAGLLKYRDNKVWHEGSMGAGSGLDADKLDGHHANYFARADQVQTNVPANAKFTDTQRPLSSSVTSTATGTAATSNAAKIAYDKGVQALNVANGKLDSGATAANSNKLGGLTPSDFARRNSTTSNDGFFYVNRNDANNATLYVNQEGAGSIARFMKGLKGGTAVEIGMEIKGDGVVESTNAFLAPRMVSENPQNKQASVSLQWTSNVPTLRVGGSGAGAESAFAVRGTSDRNYIQVDATNAYIGQSKHKAWHAGNMGAGSGLDADKLDGYQATDFAGSAKDIKTPTHLGESNLDTFNSGGHCGFYYQSANVNATAARNYPTQMAGSLTITRAAGIVQTYTTYQNPVTYQRSYYNGAWSAWAVQYNGYNKPSPSDVGLRGLQTETSVTDSTSISTPSGKLIIGKRNASWCHYHVNGTDAGHYFYQKIETAGTLKCTALYTTTSSDKRLKENVKAVEVDYDKLDKLILLTGRYNQFAGDFAGQEFYGSIAQDVQAVFPHCVSVVKNDKFGETLAVDYPKLALAIALAELQRPLKSRLKRFFKSVWSAIKGK